MVRTIPLMLAFIACMPDDPTPDKVFGKPSINAPAGRVLDIKATLPAGVSYSWAVPDQDGIDFRSSGLTGFVFPKMTGSYWIGIAYGNPIQVAWILVKVGDAGPPPPPQQPPPDKAGPRVLTFVIVSDKIPPLPPFSGYTPLTDAMLAKGHRWKLLDKEGKDFRGAASPDAAKYATLAGKTLPYLIIVDSSSGAVISSQPLPATQEEMLKIVQAADK